MVTKIGRDSFQGLSKLYGPHGLGAAIRGLAIDLAVTRVGSLNTNTMTLTDNTTGTAGATVVDLVIPGVFDASSAGGAQLAALNTALGVMENGLKATGESVNVARAKIGLPVMTFGAGTVATPLTVPAQTKTVAAAAGTSAAQYASAVAALKVAKSNYRRLTALTNETIVALGGVAVASDLSGEHVAGLVIQDIPTIVAAAASPNSSSISATEASAFLLAAANDLAKLIAVWNARVAALATTTLNVVGS